MCVLILFKRGSSCNIGACSDGQIFPANGEPVQLTAEVVTKRGKTREHIRCHRRSIWDDLLRRIDGFAVLEHAEIEMGSGGESGGADIADPLPLRHQLADMDSDHGQV